MSAFLAKLCLLGDSSVGKTSLVRRYVDNEFSDRYLMTIGAKISTKSITDKTHAIKLMIWDIEGCSDYRQLSENYLKDSTAAIIVSDISNPKSIENMQDHIDNYLKYNPKSKIYLTLNKSDLKQSEEIIQNTEKMYPQKTLHQCSAKSGNGVKELFDKIAQNLIP